MRAAQTAGPDLLERELTLTVESRRGLDVLMPGDPETHRVMRVLMRARQPVRPQWEPGFAVLRWITLDLEAEPVGQYETAVADGWKAA